MMLSSLSHPRCYPRSRGDTSPTVCVQRGVLTVFKKLFVGVAVSVVAIGYDVDLNAKRLIFCCQWGVKFTFVKKCA